jgi:hypothetical protein
VALVFTSSLAMQGKKRGKKNTHSEAQLYEATCFASFILLALPKTILIITF